MSSPFQIIGYYQGRPINLQDPICTSLPRCIIWPLCAHLSNEQAIMTDIGGDWRDLAEFIGLPSTIIQMIDGIRGRTCKAYTLLKLWDTKISRNNGTLLKLIIALYKAGFAMSYLKECIITPLQDTFDFTSIQEYVQNLQQDEIRELFPILQVEDVQFDDELESDVLLPPTREDTPPGQEDDYVHQTHIVKDSIYISYYSNSHSKTYKKNVENIARTFKHRGHVVWYDRAGYNLTSQEKENYMRSADSILVIYNKDYQQAHYNSLHQLKIPSCVATDIHVLNHMFYNVRGGKRRIIPIVIDVCRTIPSISDFPMYLTGMPRIMYPSQATALLHTVQKVPEYDIKPAKPVRRVASKKIDTIKVHQRFSPKRQ